MKRLLSSVVLAALTACGGGSGASPFGTTHASACVPKVVRVQSFGDSIAVGYNGETGQPLAVGPAQMLQTAMDAQFGVGAVVVELRAVSGTTSGQLLAGTDGLNKPWPQSVDADITMVNSGVNDERLGVPLAQYQANISALSPTIYETPTPVVNVPWAVDGYAAIAPVVADVGAYVRSLPNWQHYLADGVHPNPALYQLIVSNVLAPALAKQVAPLRCVGV